MWQRILVSATEAPANAWYDAFEIGKEIHIHFWDDDPTRDFQILVEHRLGSNDTWLTAELLSSVQGQIVMRMIQSPQIRFTYLPGTGSVVTGGFYRDVPTLGTRIADLEAAVAALETAPNIPVFDDAADLPTDGSIKLAFVEPPGGCWSADRYPSPGVYTDRILVALTRFGGGQPVLLGPDGSTSQPLSTWWSVISPLPIDSASGPHKHHAS